MAECLLQNRQFTRCTGYRLEFTELTPGTDACRVTGNLSAYDPADRGKTSKVTRFEGAFRGLDPPTAPEKPEKPSKTTKGSKETKEATGSEKLVSFFLSRPMRSFPLPAVRPDPRST
jgi:hypothetical protein